MLGLLCTQNGLNNIVSILTDKINATDKSIKVVGQFNQNNWKFKINVKIYISSLPLGRKKEYVHDIEFCLSFYPENHLITLA